MTQNCHEEDVQSRIRSAITSKEALIDSRYWGVFSSDIFPAGTSMVKEGAYSGHCACSGIGASTDTGDPLWKCRQ